VGRTAHFLFASEGKMVRQVGKELYDILNPAVAALGYELVGAEYLAQGKNSVLRVYIDSEEGVSVEDCARASHQISGVLDIEDPIKGEYVLEVSSPGLDRPLFNLAQFERFAGRRVRLLLGVPHDGRRKMTGGLCGVRDGKVVLEMEGEEILLAPEEIEKARLVPEL